MTAQVRVVLFLAVVGCTRSPMTAMTGRLPLAVSSPGDPVTVFGVRCLPKTNSNDQVCAVIVDETETVALDPKSAVASEAINGSTMSMTSWFSQPQPSPPRVFTVIAHEASRVVTSAYKVILYSQSSQYGGARSQGYPDEGAVGYVVDAPASMAIAGAHTNVRYIDATGHWDIVGAQPDAQPASPEDHDWQRAKPNLRDVERAEFRDELSGGYRVDGHVDARLEKKDESTRRCVSFSYFVEKTIRGTFPCSQTGPPRGILVIDRVATWVFAKGWGT